MATLTHARSELVQIRGQFFLCKAKISWLLVSNPHFSQMRRWPSFSNLDINSEPLTGKHTFPMLIVYRSEPSEEHLTSRRQTTTNKFGIIIGVLLLALALGAAPMPLNITLQNPTRVVTLYPNLLFVVPLLLLASLLLLYGVVGSDDK